MNAAVNALSVILIGAAVHQVRGSLDQYEMEDRTGSTSVEAIWSWLQHTRDLLSAAQQVVDLIDSGTSVLIHCSDGWDRTPQVRRTSDGNASVLDL